QVSTCLHREHEAVGDSPAPGPEGRGRWHPVERDVQLDGVERLRVQLQLRAARRRRVEPSTPVLVDEAGRADPDAIVLPHASRPTYGLVVDSVPMNLA